jgi:hypothetical protein
MGLAPKKSIQPARKETVLNTGSSSSCFGVFGHVIATSGTIAKSVPLSTIVFALESYIAITLIVEFHVAYVSVLFANIVSGSVESLASHLYRYRISGTQEGSPDIVLFSAPCNRRASQNFWVDRIVTMAKL